MFTKEYILKKLTLKKHEISRFGINKIGLFGSYVRDEQTESSDIDILIDFEPENETFDNYMAAFDFIEDLFENKKVEVITKNGLSPYIGQRILQEVRYV